MACSHPERILNLSHQIASAAATLEEHSSAARRAVAAVELTWHGSAATAFEAAGGHLATELGRDASVLGDIAATLLEMAAALEGAHTLWHEAQAAQNADAASAFPGLSVAQLTTDVLAAQAREQVTLAVQRAVLAFTAISFDSWEFGGSPLRGLVHALRQELTGQWAGVAVESLLVPGDPATTLGLAMAELEAAGIEPTGQASGVIGSVDDVLADPWVLARKSPGAVRHAIGDTPGWRQETLGRGSRKGQGWVFREYDVNGRPTGRIIRWHPGGGHHGPNPYWRVSEPDGGKSAEIPGGADDIGSWWEGEANDPSGS